MILYMVYVYAIISLVICNSNVNSIIFRYNSDIYKTIYILNKMSNIFIILLIITMEDNN